MFANDRGPKALVLLALLVALGAVLDIAVADSGHEDSSGLTENQETEQPRNLTEYSKKGHTAQIQRFSGNGSQPISDRYITNTTSNRRTSSKSGRSRSNNSTSTLIQRPDNSTTEPVPQPVTTSPSTERTQSFREFDPNVDYFPDGINSQEEPPTTAEPTPCFLLADELSNTNNQDFCQVSSQLIRQLRMTDEFRGHQEPAFLVKRVGGKWQVLDFASQLQTARKFVSAMKQNPEIMLQRSPVHQGHGDGHYDDGRNHGRMYSGSAFGNHGESDHFDG